MVRVLFFKVPAWVLIELLVLRAWLRMTVTAHLLTLQAEKIQILKPNNKKGVKGNQYCDGSFMITQRF